MEGSQDTHLLRESGLKGWQGATRPPTFLRKNAARKTTFEEVHGHSTRFSPTQLQKLDDLALLKIQSVKTDRQNIALLWRFVSCGLKIEYQPVLSENIMGFGIWFGPVGYVLRL